MENKEGLVLHWMDIIRAVFAAESNIDRGWREKLRKAKNLPVPERDAVCDGYVRAIAEEILK